MPKVLFSFRWAKIPVMSKANCPMPRHRTSSEEGQILLFPRDRDASQTIEVGAGDRSQTQGAEAAGPSVVLCGSYRKDPEGLRRVFQRLQDSGLVILSPTNPLIESEKEGFVYMRHEGTQTPEAIEARHLDAIQRADFVWFFAPDGYVGPTGSLEVGFARANGIPVFSDTLLGDTTVKQFVDIVDSPEVVRNVLKHRRSLPPGSVLKSFQQYYRRAAIERGYAKETAKDCLMLMVEEVGELARALRKRAHLARHGPEIVNQDALELADVFLYVVHMANILDVDLSRAVQEKELINIKRVSNAR